MASRTREVVRLERERRAAERVRDRTETRLSHADAVMRRYEEAYRAVRGSAAPPMAFSKGWYILNYGNPRKEIKLREAQLEMKTRTLWAAQHAREIEPDED